MELVSYVFMAAGAYVVLVTRVRGSIYGWFVLFVVYSVVARVSPEMTSDMQVYYSAAETWPPPFSLYTLREPIVWFGSSFLFLLTGSHFATFIIFDVAAALIVLRSMKLLDDGDGRMLSLGPTIISSYVFLLGQQNVLRQHLSLVILLYALAARSRKQSGAVWWFAASVLTHNVAAILVGYWLDIGTSGRRRYGPVVTLVGVILLKIMWPWLGKSSSYTGLETAYFYIVLGLALGILLLYADNGRIGCLRVYSPALLNFFAFAPAVGYLASDQFERVAMIFLVLILVELYRYQLPLRIRKVEMAHLTCVVLVLPVFFFHSTLSKLL